MRSCSMQVQLHESVLRLASTRYVAEARQHLRTVRKVSCRQAVRAEGPTKPKAKTQQYLSDILSFESENGVSNGAAPISPAEEGSTPAAASATLPTSGQPMPTKAADKPESAQALVDRAGLALDSARVALERARSREPARSAAISLTFSSGRDDLRSAGVRKQEESVASLEAALARSGGQGQESAGGDVWDWANDLWDSGRPAAGSSGSSGRQQPPEAQLQRAQQPLPMPAPELIFAEPALSQFLDMPSQEAQDLERARAGTLPPMQSVLELTSAAAPPQRGMEPAMADTAPSTSGRKMEDGRGRLADGTVYEQTSGEELGKDGYWFRWTCLRGISPRGKVEWEEKWWEASDWAGMREMGAEKSGCRLDGSAWRETWRESLTNAKDGSPTVERSAHKWAQDAKGEEWEEKWGEQYEPTGQANKWADKWAKKGPEIWHEKWGEDYDGQGGCKKYTDKWAEKIVEGGGVEKWGDKWEETFGGGAGFKTGETWSIGAGGEAFNRWWGEDHRGGGSVRKHGSSTAGEYWDQEEQMDTYYNPIPHFDYRLALQHSPQLRNVSTLPRGRTSDFEDGGLSAL
ncbi:hypothetical protein WJX84_003121 [Apatococcus fuscideae]|uniref:Uncharacterized protein n=1 Tax=Apatococcus fuscideae TaxID=2026836 RepID=A0AAW1TEM2_9CHLO